MQSHMQLVLSIEFQWQQLSEFKYYLCGLVSQKPPLFFPAFTQVFALDFGDKLTKQMGNLTWPVQT